MAFLFRLQRPFNQWIFSKIYQSKGLKPKNKGHTNFYEHCDLTKKSISSAHDLMVIHIMIDRGILNQQGKYEK